jgi:type IV secretory pathway VirB10-like protein
MKINQEKSPLNKINKRFMVMAGLAVGGLLLAILLYNTLRPAPPQRGMLEQQIRSGDARFLRNDPTAQEPQPDEPLQQTDSSQAAWMPPPETIFQRSGPQRTQAGIREQSRSVEQRPAQQRIQTPDRGQELYEQALTSSIRVGESVRLRENMNQERGWQDPEPSSARMENYQGERQSQRMVTEFEHPVTPYTIMEGTLIEATLQTAITSALPGNIVGVVNRDVFDSVRQNHLLIPRGTRLIGAYESGIAFDQRKLMMSWDRLIFPDGRSMNLPAVPTHDLMGMSGLGGDVKTHFWSTFGQSAMLSLIGASASFAISGGGGGYVGGFGGMTARETIALQVARDFQRVANQLLQRNMNRQPTIEIEAGTRFTVFVLDDIFFAEPFELTYLD